MKKVLIYKNINDLKPVGGPNGYLYNLKQGLVRTDTHDICIEFLNVKNNERIVNLANKILKKSSIK